MQLMQQEKPADLLAGRYQLEECIGEGGMARVYRAVDVQLGRVVAVKMMQSTPEMPVSTSRAQTEMRALASLNHHALVKLFDGSVEPGEHPYLVMEFVDGTTLARRLNAGALPPREVTHLGRELASALHAVHEAGIVHRDVKPSNVLLGTNVVPGRPESVKLADFGVAFLVDSTRVTTPGLVVGTAAYLSPEQVRGVEVAPASDIYALGLVLLEALTGSRAFPHASGVGAVMARLIDAPSVPEWVGPEWAQLLNRMTAIDPAQRPTAGEVAQAMGDLPTDIRPGSASAEPAVTQESIALPVAAIPRTRVMTPLTAPPAPVASRRARRRHMKKPLVFAGAAAAAAISITATAFAVAGDRPPNQVDELVAVIDAPTVDSPVEAPPAAPATPDTGLGTIEPAVDTPAREQQAPDHPSHTQGNGQGADQADKDAAKAEREAEKLQREAEKDERESKR